ncbi:hypothetical protein BJ165DRAFT_1530849 [Panaeolus papilionaceus]|nr:hypothetical protein BJ165DRAFT_1530849 [Panaeolus papilionaceus]
MSSSDSTSTRRLSSGSNLGPSSGAENLTGDTERVLRDSQMDVSSPTQLSSRSPTTPSSRSQSALSRTADQNTSAPRDRTSPFTGPRPQDADNAARGETDTRMARMEELWYGTLTSEGPRPQDADSLVRGQTGHRSSVSMARLEELWYGTRHVTHSWWEQHEPRIGRRQSSSAAHDNVRQSTRKKVAQAVASSLDIAADVAHQALYVGVDLLDLAPIPGLSTAAKTLLAIWDAADKVDLNGISCLRLTERCADILISVREEISHMGDEVGIELSAPIVKLEESFARVADTMNKQANRPFLKRYLKRDEIFLEIGHCDSLLKDAMTLFNYSIQFRILSLVRESNRRQNVDQQEIKELMRAIASGHIPVAAQTRATILPNIEATPTSIKTETQQPESLLLSTEPVEVDDAAGVSANPDHAPEIPQISILQTLHHIYLSQNSVDAALDLLQLRKIMRDALQATNDAEMLQVLQIGESEMPDAIRTLRRALDTSISAVQSNPSVSAEASVMTESVVDGSAQQKSVPRSRDTLDYEFMETGIVALQRLSERHPAPNVPSWAITKYEIVRDEVIGAGAYSWVYRGKWDGKTVAIKVLKDFLTPREIFIKEVEIWNMFKHPNILPLFGASSTQGEPPWFFVSPYMQHGSLLDHLQKVERDRRPSGLGLEPAIHSASPFHLHVPERADSVPIPPRRGSNAGREHTLPATSAHTTSNIVEREWDLFRFMHHIAKGMEYLHSRNPPVLHGDLKAANVLVDSRFCALVADFGQSELKTGWTGKAMSGGTLRWQAPEIWGGAGPLTPAVDVWAFSITCTEILNMGRMPWRNVDDAAVQVLVREHNSRPDIPPTSRFNTHDLRDILSSCWQMDTSSRPSFAKISRDLKHLRRALGRGLAESPQAAAPMDLAVTQIDRTPSPSLAPIRIPSFLQNTAVTVVDDVLGGGNDTVQFTRTSTDSPRVDLMIPTAVVEAPTPGLSTATSRRSTLESPPTSAQFDQVEFEQYHISPQEDEVTSFRNALKYRLNLQHDFYPLEMLPLWDPTPVEVGAVGYLSKAAGQFVTLFNSLRPHKCDNFTIRNLLPLRLPGLQPIGTQRIDKRTPSQKAYDLIAGSLTLPHAVSSNVSRQCSYHLKKGLTAAHLYTEIMEYHYMNLDSTEVPKTWFSENADTILKVYGYRHQIQKEDLFLVLGEIRTPGYALFVSHSHPEGQAHFNVFANRKHNHPWGAFTFEHSTPTCVPHDHVDVDPVPFDFHSKISDVGDPWETVLLARLRFRPDSSIPTSR